MTSARKPAPASTKKKRSAPRIFAEANRAEYLAQFYLSALGPSVPTPRQEDHGIDFTCTLDVAPPAELPDYRHPFFVQIKSSAREPISFGGSTKGRKWRSGQIHWLLNLDIPLFVGYLNTRSCELEVFHTTVLWLLQLELLSASRPPYAIELTPGYGDGPISDRAAGKISSAHSGRIWTVFMGNPIAVMSLESVRDKTKLTEIKKRIRNLVMVHRTNAGHRSIGSQFAQFRAPEATGFEVEDMSWAIEMDSFDSSAGWTKFQTNALPLLGSMIVRLKHLGDEESWKQASGLYRLLRGRCSIPPKLDQFIESRLAPET